MPKTTFGMKLVLYFVNGLPHNKNYMAISVYSDNVDQWYIA